jgi:hypothetical protein
MKQAEEGPEDVLRPFLMRNTDRGQNDLLIA